MVLSPTLSPSERGHAHTEPTGGHKFAWCSDAGLTTRNKGVTLGAGRVQWWQLVLNKGRGITLEGRAARGAASQLEALGPQAVKVLLHQRLAVIGRGVHHLHRHARKQGAM